ncbi:hypothetical protein HY641_00435, partial [Candidatus Woesearchaeota archaeon]|nr:hypothetical protein [Candidatus Woesearchaeota archaeon]
NHSSAHTPDFKAAMTDLSSLVEGHSPRSSTDNNSSSSTKWLGLSAMVLLFGAVGLRGKLKIAWQTVRGLAAVEWLATRRNWSQLVSPDHPIMQKLQAFAIGKEGFPLIVDRYAMGQLLREYGKSHLFPPIAISARDPVVAKIAIEEFLSRRGESRLLANIIQQSPHEEVVGITGEACIRIWQQNPLGDDVVYLVRAALQRINKALAERALQVLEAGLDSRYAGAAMGELEDIARFGLPDVSLRGTKILVGFASRHHENGEVTLSLSRIAQGGLEDHVISESSALEAVGSLVQGWKEGWVNLEHIWFMGGSSAL